MHLIRSIRRLALGAALTGAAVGAIPAMASAASPFCLYNPTTKQITIDETSSSPTTLQILRTGDNIAVYDFIGPVQICTNQVDFFTVPATVFNTDRIVVNSKNTQVTKKLFLEQLGPGATHEADGVDEIETLVSTTNRFVSLHLVGSPQPDGIRVGATGINFGLDVNASDNDVDIQTTTRPERIAISGLSGDDGISGRGNFFAPRPTDVPLTIDGGGGNDFVEGGLARDRLFGGGIADTTGNDRLFSNDGQLDELDGGPGFDTATTDGGEKSVTGVEARTVEPVGHLRLAPRVLKAEAGRTARLTMRWMHPRSWRELREVEVSVHRGKKAVGVQATGSDGQRQVERGAGTIELER
jgi:hypothetical protein